MTLLIKAVVLEELVVIPFEGGELFNACQPHRDTEQNQLIPILHEIVRGQPHLVLRRAEIISEDRRTSVLPDSLFKKHTEGPCGLDF